MTNNVPIVSGTPACDRWLYTAVRWEVGQTDLPWDQAGGGTEARGSDGSRRFGLSYTFLHGDTDALETTGRGG